MEWTETRVLDGTEVEVTVEEVTGNSGTYLVVTVSETDEVLEDGRPWQMREGQS